MTGGNVKGRLVVTPEIRDLLKGILKPMSAGVHLKYGRVYLSREKYKH